jgi:hypothetical protein
MATGARRLPWEQVYHRVRLLTGNGTSSYLPLQNGDVLAQLARNARAQIRSAAG